MNDAQATLLKYLAVMTGGAGLAGLAFGARRGMADPQDATELNTISPEVVNVPMPKRKKPQLGFKLASLGGWLAGDTANHWWEVPIAPTAGVALPIAAFFGAENLAKNIGISIRKAKMRRQVDKAQKNYTNSLLNAYPSDEIDFQNKKMAEIDADLTKLAHRLKVAEDIMVPTVTPKTPSIIDSIPDAVEKSTGYRGLAHAADSTGKTIGNTMAGLLIAGGLAIPAGMAYTAYNFFRDRSKTKMLNEAARLRQYGRLQSNMPEIYVATGE